MAEVARAPAFPLLARLLAMPVRAGDSPETVLRKKAATLCYAIGTAVLLLAAGIAFAVGRRDHAGPALATSLLTTVVLLVVTLSGRGSLPALWLAAPISLLLPALNVHLLGGFYGSGGSPMWGLLAPVTAVLFLGKRAAGFFCVAFLALLVYSVLPGHQVPEAGATQLAVILVFNFFTMGLFVVGVLHWFNRDRDRVMVLLDRERARNERLLLDVLPEEVASALKDGNASIAHHEQVTVLFADLVGFTPLSASTTPKGTVALLEEIFGELDALAERHGVEKIKTIGDCYMVAAGVPNPNPDHAAATARFALAVRALLRERTFGGRAISFRIGMHSGPVIAGVIGRKRFLYDLWGDTVNTASRMEQHGAPNEVQVSDATAALLTGAFELEDRGEVPVKGKGAMRLWFVRGEKGAHKGAPEAGPVG